MHSIIEFFKRLFGVDTNDNEDSGGSSGSLTTSFMTVSTAGDLGPLGQFVLSLSCDETARTAWTLNRAQAISNSGLNTNDQGLLTNGNMASIQNQIVQESGGGGSRIWICVWIR